MDAGTIVFCVVIAAVAFVVGLLVSAFMTRPSADLERYYRAGFDEGRTQGRQDAQRLYPVSDSEIVFDGEGGFQVVKSSVSGGG